jgi:predicted nuclease of predicted toxin-antitoxin system
VDILMLAVSEGRMTITMDKDFGELVYNSGKAHSGVLILRLEDAKGRDKTEVVERILSDFPIRLRTSFVCFRMGNYG